jgi:membrane-associated phospholipid phosphatase
MDTVLQWGIDLILAIHQWRSPGITQFFHTVTQFGGRWHMWIVPALVWCLGYRFGSRLLITLLLSAFVNFALKDIFGQPRPFQLDPRTGIETERGFGLPSGHAQHTAIEWGAVAAWVAKPWFTAAALVLIFLIGVSRIYLGVHFPTDVLGGWMLAAVIFWIYLRYADAIAARVSAMSFAGQVALAALVSAFYVLFYLLVPLTSYLVGTGGLLFGAAVGMALCHRWLTPPEGGALWQRLLRYPLGIAPLVTWASLASGWLPDAGRPEYYVVSYLNNVVAGLWLTAGAPALFQLARLSPVGAAADSSLVAGKSRAGRAPTGA